MTSMVSDLAGLDPAFDEAAGRPRAAGVDLGHLNGVTDWNNKTVDPVRHDMPAFGVVMTGKPDIKAS